MSFSQGHALLVGVGGTDLPNTVDDAKGLASILCDTERCAYPPNQVTVLTQAEATRARILAALEALADRTDEESTAVVYFSGHGYFITTQAGKDYFLIPHGYDLSDLPGTAVRDSEFAAALGKLRAKKLLVLLDCCHAGGLEQAKEPGLLLEKAPLPPKAEEVLKNGNGRVAIASSRAGELSYAGKPYSAFTQALIEGLAGNGANNQDGYARVADLAMYTSYRVPGRTGDKQHPVLHFEKADNFPVAYYAGGDLKPKGPPFEIPTEVEDEPGDIARRRAEPASVFNVSVRTNTGFENHGLNAGGAIVQTQGNVNLSGADLSVGAPVRKPRPRRTPK